MSMFSNKHFSTRLYTKNNVQASKNTLTTMPCQKPINLKINESGQHVLPFPRRVDGISTHRLIRDEQRKQQQLLSSTKSRLESYIGIHGSTEEEKKEGEKNNLHFDKYLYSMAKV
ncbi:unnamed protein product [Rotaria sp. Silwood1]|nr:unnamed protein product [Rotaria sp. Silwood1]CAF3939929.1 unnamed protein product [Rotaria sp. Silwood1]CAF5004815.1 unnamed protein product [Rotaria sp. Silwood1]